MNPAVGVDLGTTNTVVAIQTDATGPRTLDIPQPRDERNVFETLDHIKSAVYFESANAAVVEPSLLADSEPFDPSSHAWDLAGGCSIRSKKAFA